MAQASAPLRRRRPGDAGWPSSAAWKRLNDAVGGNLIAVRSPVEACAADAHGADCTALFANLRNPYYIADQPALTETTGWTDAWSTQPSAYAVAARSAADISAAVLFARQHDLRLVVKGRGHSYQGTSNAPDSLLVWTHFMHDVTLHDAFVAQGCPASTAQAAVTLDAGADWIQAYSAVTTRAGRYVQGGGCTTVGVAGLIQSGGFGSFSKHYGTAAAGLLEAEVVTADGKIRTVNRCMEPDLFWALKGGGGGSFGVVSRITLRLRDLPASWGGAHFTVKAASDDAYRRLIRRFVGFYRDALFNDHWGEQANFSTRNELDVSMVFHGLSAGQAQAAWKPFLDWVAASPNDYAFDGSPDIGTLASTKAWWDPQWRKEHGQDVFRTDPRTGADPNSVWWKGDAGQVGWFIYGFDSLWLPASLLEGDAQERLANALFASTRSAGVGLHFNKGLAGAPADAIAAARDTATNPLVLDAFALAITADGQGPAFPGIPGHEPDAVAGRSGAANVGRCADALRAIVPVAGSYVSESNYFEKNWQTSYWGSNYPRLAAIKKRYDPTGLFFVHNGVGSEEWSADGFTRR